MIGEHEEYFDKSTTDPNDSIPEAPTRVVYLSQESFDCIKELVLNEFQEYLENPKFCSIGRHENARKAAMDMHLWNEIKAIEKDYNFDKN
jgi:hypothetical protein